MRPWMIVPAWYAAVAVAAVAVVVTRRRKRREAARAEVAYLEFLYAIESAEEPS